MKSTIAIAAAPAFLLVGVGAAHAATDPSEVVIPDLSAEVIGPMSSAGKMPNIDLEADEVSRAFTKYVTYKSVAKVVRGTDGQATKKGSKTTSNGFRCTAKTFSYVNPGTAGQYAMVGWRCVFKAADTPTKIVMTYDQASL